MWQANRTWGSPGIVGELQKFGIDIAKSTVERYRPKLRGPTSPSWNTFLKQHIRDIVAIDFFTVVGPEFSSQLIMLKESFRQVIICLHEPGYFFRDLLLDGCVAFSPFPTA